MERGVCERGEGERGEEGVRGGAREGQGGGCYLCGAGGELFRHSLQSHAQ